MWDTRQTRFAAHFSNNKKNKQQFAAIFLAPNSMLHSLASMLPQFAKCNTQSDILIDEYINTRFNQIENNKEKEKQTKKRSKKSIRKITNAL